MGKLKCHITDYTKGDHLGVDEEIARKLGWKPDRGNTGYFPNKIAAYRGLYDQENESSPLIPDDVVNPTREQIDQACEKLKSFMVGTAQANRVKVIDHKKDVPRAYDRLRHVFSVKERAEMVTSISELFSKEVDRLLKKRNEHGFADERKVPRKAIVEGFYPFKGASLVGGAPALLEGVFNELLDQRQYCWECYKDYQNEWEYTLEDIEAAKLPGAKYPEDRYLLEYSGAPTNAEEFRDMMKARYEAVTKVLENWHAFLPFVMRDLVDKEGVKINLKHDYMTAASSDNYDADSIAAKWNQAESVREGWQRNNDKESAYAEIGQQVRRFLSTVYEVETVPEFEVKGGKRVYVGSKTLPVYNSMGYHVYKDPVRMHQMLSEYFRGIQSQKDLMEKLFVSGSDRTKIPWMQPLGDIVSSNPQLATQLFVDFRKNFQLFSMMQEDKNNSDGLLKKMKTFVINKAKNLLKERYELSLDIRGKHPVNVKVWGYEPVFEEGAKGGKVNWRRLAELRKHVLQWVYEEPLSTGTGLDKIVGSKVYGVNQAWLTDRRKDTSIVVDGERVPLDYEKKREFLMEVFTSLGIDVTVDSIDSILNSSDIYKVREILEKLFCAKATVNTKTGFAWAAGNYSYLDKIADPNISEKDKEEKIAELDKTSPSFKVLYNRTFENSNYEITPVKEQMEKLMDIINKHQEGMRVESRARYMDNTLFSNVKPCYLGDRLETIENFVKKDDHQGLLNFLKEEYLQSPFFVDADYIATNGEKGKILNLWLSDLVDACKGKRNLNETVASIFNYERDLGSDVKEFEDFTIKEHGTDMLVHFFADEQQHKGYSGKGTKDVNKKLTALYPVFILGDSGVSKYIRAPRITTAVPINQDGEVFTGQKKGESIARVEQRFDDAAKKKVIDSFWNLYLQETRRMAMDKALTFDLYANGKPVKHSEGEFSFLTFLNPSSQEYISDYHIPEDMRTDEHFVKEVIKKYLENATLNNVKRADGTVIPSFKQRLQDMGLLETAKGSHGEGYKSLYGVMTPENVDSKLTEFYWNTALATAMQMQLLTIDPWFYANTKELQKRYKENHAPGNMLDIMARDRKGRLYSEDGIERCVYFKDEVINAETYNPDFMEAVLRAYAKEGADVDAAIAEGILKPATTNAEAITKHNKLVDLMGEKVRIYETYMKNTLTDGQGYRTLKSYRKVMGMYGKWNEDMEDAYDYIMEVRAKCAEEHRSATKEELKKISDWALVLQPIKPFMFTHEKVSVRVQRTDNEGKAVLDAEGNPIIDDQVMYIPVQHKYAEALIIPELLPEGNKLRDLALWMDDNNVDLAGSDKICKVGCFGQCDLKDVTDSQSLTAALNTATKHELSYRDYRVQTNVPEHINVSRLFGTQIRKLIMAGLKKNGEYFKYLNVKGVNLSTDGEKNKECKLTGDNLLALYNSLICCNIMDSYERFSDNAGDINTLAEMLQQSTIGNTRESMDNLFSYLVRGDEAAYQKFAVSLAEGGLEHDSASLILSTFRNIVNKQQINGGSAVQVSAFGINGYSRSGDLRFVQDPNDKSNILYAEIEMPFDKTVKYTVTDSSGNTSTSMVNLEYEAYCNMDGSLIPSGKALEKGTDEYRKYLSYTYKEVDGKLVSCSHTDPEAKVYKPKIEKDYPGILNIIAYRIPTESTYSMLNCQIKRFSSKMAGGTIKVPGQGTGIAGFDFDIDKLYFMMREYHKTVDEGYYDDSNYSEDDKWKVWNAIYKDYEGVFIQLQIARRKATQSNDSLVLGNDYTEDRKKWASLNSYYDEIDGKSLTGKSKRELFQEYAQKLGLTPAENASEEAKKESLESYDFTKTPEDNSRVSRNNLLIDLMQARLMDRETMEQRYTPGGFDEAKDAARFLRELKYGDITNVVSNDIVDLEALKERKGDDTDPEPNYSVIDPYTMLVYNQQNQLAAKLIGIFANQNTHTAFVSCLDKFCLKQPINFCGHTNMKDLLHKDNQSLANDCSLRVAQFRAASVDAVKDPVLNFMNLNTLTADAAALLARLGYNMNEIGLFLSQPVIVDICQETFNSGRNIRSVIADKQSKLLSKVKGDPSTMKNPSANDLALGIINDRKMREQGEDHDKFYEKNAKLQYAVLSIFSNLQKASQDVSDFVASTKFTASNAVGSTFGAMYAQQLKVNSYLDKFTEKKGKSGGGKGSSISFEMEVNSGADTGLMSTPLDNSDKMLEMKKSEYLKYVRRNPFAFEQAMYDTNRKAVKALSKYYPYETGIYKKTREIANDILSRYGTLSEDDINSIHRDIPVYMLARQTESDFYGEGLHKVKNADGKYVKSDITNREYYREKFVKDLVGMLEKHPELRDLEIFKFMTPHKDKVVYGKNGWGLDITKDVWTVTMQDVGGLDAKTKEMIKESWESLMDRRDDNGEYKNPEYAELAKDLFMYCYYQMGFQFSPISFMHLTPTVVKESIRFDMAASQPINTFDEGATTAEDVKPDDVIVWSKNAPRIIVGIRGENGMGAEPVGELHGNTFNLGEELTKDKILWLVNAAIDHPELRFKIDRTLTQEEFDLFSNESLGKNVPSNIYFSKGTIENVDTSDVAKDYGRTISYTQFLDNILQEKEGNFDTNDFLKQWILNHPDNSRFVFDITRCNQNLRKSLATQAKESLKVSNGKTITFDVSTLFGKENDSKGEGVSSLDNLVKFEGDGNTLNDAKWSPVIVYNGSYYIADSEDSSRYFNNNASFKMTYVKVTPLGSSKNLVYDNNQKLSISMRYQSYFGEEGEDLSHAEYTRQVTPTQAELDEEKRKAEEQGIDSTVTLNPEANGSDVKLEGRDSSDISNAMDALKEFAENSGMDVEETVWENALDKLRNADLRNEVLNEDDPMEGDTYDTVQKIMQDALGKRNWLKMGDLQEKLVQAVFDYNKNPKYLEMPSQVNAEDAIEWNPEVRSDILEIYKENKLKGYLADLRAAYKSKGFAEEEINRLIGEAVVDLIQDSEKVLHDTVQAAMKACREDGVLMLDSEGNMTTGC